MGSSWTARRTAKAGLGGLVVLLLSAGLAVAASGDGGGAVYHGCVNRTNGVLRIVAAGDSCREPERAIVWNEVGPAGPQGPQGVTGPQGATGPTGAAGVVSLQSLAGTQCTRADGSAGTVAALVNADNSISLSCGPVGSWCDTNTPAVGPHMSVACDNATQRVTYTCDTYWVDRNHDPSDGCEVSTGGLAPISYAPSAAALLANTGVLFSGVDTAQVPADCGGALESACPDGKPSDPLPTLAIDMNMRAGDSPRVVAVPDAADSRYDITARFRLRTNTDIPIVTPIAGACGLALDTTRGSVADLTVTFHDNVVTPDGPTVVSDVAVTGGLETADYSITGGLGCQLANVGVTPIVAAVQHALAPWISRRGVICGAPDPLDWQACPTNP